MNRVMTAARADRVDEIWAEHRDRTRAAILDAVTNMLHTDNPATISMPRVAERAGVSTRTLYRYFPDKDALMDAASGWLDEQARISIGGTVTPENVQAYLRELWVALAENVAAVRAQHAGGPGRDLRRRRLERARADIGRRVPPEVPPDRRDDMVDVLIAVMSSSMMLELVDRMGHPPEHAADLAARVAELVVADATGTLHVGTPEPTLEGDTTS